MKKRGPIPNPNITRFRCRVCGKLTAGRIPREGRYVGDLSARFPRRHNVNGQPCPGIIEDAEWIDVPLRAAREVAR